LIYAPGRSLQTDIDRRKVHEEYKHSGDTPVLVIDDHPDAIDLMRETLEGAGYKVLAAQDGVQGLRLAREVRPLAITLDVMMPNKDGWQVLHDLKTDPLTKGIPVILVTVVDKKTLGYRLGAADYLVKPLDADEVLESLARAAGKQQAPQLLVVDDDPDVIDMIKQLLGESPYRIETAADGEQALEAVRSAPPDIILLDLLMPNLDGFGVIEELRMHPETIRIPIIILTAKTVTRADMESLRDRIYAIVQKQGLQGDALLAQIEAAMAEGSKE
jgi:CheY-like chemotaxis protein